MEKQLKSLKIWSLISGVTFIISGIVLFILGLSLAFVGAIPGLMVLFIGIFYSIIAVRIKRWEILKKWESVEDVIRFTRYTIQIQFISLLTFFGAVTFTVLYIKEKLQNALDELGVSENIIDLIKEVVKSFL